jgi:threonine dehydratase
MGGGKQSSASSDGPMTKMQSRVTAELSLARIEAAAQLIEPQFRSTPQYVDPQLSRAVGREVMVKVEVANPLGSFKGRGADFFVRELEPGPRLVCATGGNFGQALAYAGRRHGFPVDVFVSATLDAGKLERIRALATDVRVMEGDDDDAKEAAREYAAGDAGLLFVEDGREVAIAEGAGTIGVELVAETSLDTLVIQVGDGALIGGVARWVKEHSPNTRIVGVCPSGSPAMALSWREGRPVTTARADTIASALATRSPVPESVARLRRLVDDFVLVDDADMVEAMRIVADTLGILVEPAGAAGVAAILRHDIPGERLAVLLTGQGLPAALRAEVLGRAR